MKRMCLIISHIKIGFSQKELAEKIGVSQQTIQKWENGTASPKTFAVMKDVEAVLKNPKERLFNDIFGKKGCANCGTCSNSGGSGEAS